MFIDITIIGYTLILNDVSTYIFYISFLFLTALFFLWNKTLFQRRIYVLSFIQIQNVDVFVAPCNFQKCPTKEISQVEASILQVEMENTSCYKAPALGEVFAGVPGKGRFLLNKKWVFATMNLGVHVSQVPSGKWTFPRYQGRFLRYHFLY